MRCWLFVFLFAAFAVAQEAELRWGSGPRSAYADRAVPIAEGAGRVTVGGASLIVERAAENRVRVDRDFDGDTSDEPAYVLPATVELGGQGLRVFLFEREGELRIAPLAHREGAVLLEGRVRAVALYDGDGDLRFEHPERDRLLVDARGDGRLLRVTPGAPFRVRGAGYVASVPGADGRRVVFRRVDAAPPRAPAPWEPEEVPPAGRPAPGNEDSLAILRRRYDRARKMALKTGTPFGISRAALLEAIGEVGTKPAFRLLLGVYEHEKDPSVRAAAVAAMGYADYRPFAKNLLRIAAKEEDPTVAAAALYALHAMDAPDRDDVLTARLAAARDERVCEAAALCLAWRRVPDADDALFAAARGLPTSALRYHAYRAWTTYRATPPPAEAVRAAAQDDEPRLRALVLRHADARALPETRALAEESLLLARLHPDLQLAVVDVLGREVYAGTVEALLPLAKQGDPEVCARLAEVLEPVRDPAALGALRRALDDDAALVRAVAAEALAGVPGAEIDAALAARLAAEEAPEPLRALIRAAGRRRLAEPAARLVAIARTEPALRREAIRALARIGLAAAPVREFFHEVAERGAWEERILALDAAAAAGDAAFVPLILANLAHEVWQVRLAAAQALGVVRVKEAVAPLIDRLAAEKSKRVRRAVAEALFRITGQQLLDMEELWRRWWQENGATFEVPAHVEGAAGETKTVATFYGVPVDSDRIVFVVDRSGSMAAASGNRTELQKAVLETLRVVGTLGERARANVILFSTGVKAWRPGLVAMKKRQRASLTAFLRAQQANGGTNIYDALEKALLMDGVESIYLLSDGEPTYGRYRRPDDILVAVMEINELRRITIHTVSLGGESRLLRELAQRNGGRYVAR